MCDISFSIFLHVFRIITYILNVYTKYILVPILIVNQSCTVQITFDRFIYMYMHLLKSRVHIKIFFLENKNTLHLVKRTFLGLEQSTLYLRNFHFHERI